MIHQLLVTFGTWVALLVVSTGLIGVFIQGLFQNIDLDKMTDADISEYQKVKRRANITSPILIVIYLGVLFYFWNIGFAIAALMIMIARIPDLLWEMRYGKEKIKEMPPIYMLTLLIMLAAFPVLWYSF